MYPLEPNQSYPKNERYTLQHLSLADKYITKHRYSIWTPNNVDAAFVTSTDHPRPSALLLHYRYAANALKRWGQNTHKLSEMPGFIQVLGSSQKRPAETSGERFPAKRTKQAGGASIEAKDPMDLLLEIPHLRQNILDAQAARQEELRSNVLEWQGNTSGL